MKNFIVTTIRKPDTATKNFARKISLSTGGKFVEREDNSFDALKKVYGVENILRKKFL